MAVLVLILVVVDDGLVHCERYSHLVFSLRLNPCCSGRWSRTNCRIMNEIIPGAVLILVVVDDGLVQVIESNSCVDCCLNPCCSGRWSRTRPYKTLLIINKLKNFTKQIFTFLDRKLTIS